MSINASICIVTHNRKAELKLTLDKVLELIDTNTEVIVGLDGCTDGTNSLKSEFPNVIWIEFPKNIGASSARRLVYEKAKGDYIFGFDDDSHPVTGDFVKKTIQIFNNNPHLGILAFRIYNGLHLPEAQILDKGIGNSYACSEFAGCGYAITRKAYLVSGGFPKWMHIYGEESYVSLKAFEKGYHCSYEPSILVHHRINKEARSSDGYQKFRFGLQLKNNLVLFLKLYPFPLNIRSLIKCTFHNFFKYGFNSFAWHIVFWETLFSALKDSLHISESKVAYAVLSDWMKLPLPVFDWNPQKISNA